LSSETKQAKICAARSKKNAKSSRKNTRARHRSAKKREKERAGEFEQELAKQSKVLSANQKRFYQHNRRQSFKNKARKERSARKAELNRAVLSKVQSPQKAQSGRLSTSKNDKTKNKRRQTNRLPSARKSHEFRQRRRRRANGQRSRRSFSRRNASARENKKSASRRRRNSQKNSSLGEKLQNQAKSSNLRLDTEDANAELNLIGKTTADAEYEIDRFFDEAYIAACRASASFTASARAR
jgi:hypothetical protein